MLGVSVVYSLSLLDLCNSHRLQFEAFRLSRIPTEEKNGGNLRQEFKGLCHPRRMSVLVIAGPTFSNTSESSGSCFYLFEYRPSSESLLDFLFTNVL